MIGRAPHLTKTGFLYIKDNPQLLVTLLLVVVIPVAFLISAKLFLEVSVANQNTLENERIGLLHDVFATTVGVARGDTKVIQSTIEEIAINNPDITVFRIAKEEGGNIIPIAALNTEVTDKPEGPAIMRLYKLAYTHENESLIVPYIDHGVRYLQAVRTFRVGDIDYFIFTEMSQENKDLLFAERQKYAYVWLFSLLAIVLYLVFRHVRLIDYGYMYRDAQRTIESKDLFTNMVAHELRTPLTSIRGYASMIREDSSVQETVREQARRIEESSARLVLIVSDLLDVARIQSGKLSVVSEKVNMSDAVHSVVDTLQVQAAAKHIGLTHEGAEQPVVIMGDKKRLHQALTNLVSNAVKYTTKGSITISLEEREDRIELRVKDTGMGIDAENQKKLFAPFFRVDAKDVSAITGTGLGMWVTKQLIELMRGSIGVESIKGVGTHIVVTLPKE